MRQPPYEPQDALRFFDAQTNRDMLLNYEGSWAGWLFYRHPDGQWVSYRRATVEDLRTLEERLPYRVPPAIWSAAQEREGRGCREL